MTEVEGEYAPRFGADAGKEVIWIGKGAAIVTQSAWGTYSEAARRGYVYSASTVLTGMAALASPANVSPLPAATGQPIIGIYVPGGSLFDVAILRTKIWNVSGTPGAGAFAWNMVPNSVITAVATRGNSHLTGAATSGASVFLNTATTGSAAGVLLRGIGPTFFAAGLAASAGPLLIEEVTDGDIYVTPGLMAAIAAPAAGTTWIVGASVTWAEIPRTSQ